jgi:hypothetical protein
MYTARWDTTMATEKITELIDSLTPQEEKAVREFIHFLKGKGIPSPSPFAPAVNEFIEEYPELLRRLSAR